MLCGAGRRDRVFDDPVLWGVYGAVGNVVQAVLADTGLSNPFFRQIVLVSAPSLRECADGNAMLEYDL